MRATFLTDVYEVRELKAYEEWRKLDGDPT